DRLRRYLEWLRHTAPIQPHRRLRAPTRRSTDARLLRRLDRPGGDARAGAHLPPRRDRPPRRRPPPNLRQSPSLLAVLPRDRSAGVDGRGAGYLHRIPAHRGRPGPRLLPRDGNQDRGAGGGLRLDRPGDQPERDLAGGDAQLYLRLPLPGLSEPTLRPGGPAPTRRDGRRFVDTGQARLRPGRQEGYRQDVHQTLRRVAQRARVTLPCPCRLTP